MGGLCPATAADGSPLAFPALGLFAEPGTHWPLVGAAYFVSHSPHQGRSVAVFQITIGKEETPGRFICDRRRFIELADGLGREAIVERVKDAGEDLPVSG